MMLLRSVVFEGEPDLTLYTSAWWEARGRTQRLVTPRHQKLFSRLLDQVEAAWLHIRPFQLFYEENFGVEGMSGDVAAFLCLDVCDKFLALAADCAEMIPSEERWPRNLTYGEVEADAGVVVRNLKILKLGLAHPDFPSELRGLVSAAACAVDGWYEGFVNAVEPAEELINSVLFLNTPKPELQPILAPSIN